MQPMLASPATDKYPLKFPLYASPKIDGVRAYVKDGVLLSRSGKPIRNKYVQKTLGFKVLDGLDGELCVGNPWDKNLMQQTTSGVMSADGEPKFTYYVFDVWSWPDTPYKRRYAHLAYTDSLPSYVKDLHQSGMLHFLEHVVMIDQNALDTYEQDALAIGYEGVMVRDPEGPYKYGRSTAKEGYLLKLKRWEDGEAQIIEFQEFMHNANELEQDEYGYAKRSTHQENKVPMNKLGALICKDIVTGAQLKIGTGFDDEMRKTIWYGRETFRNQIVKYKHFAQAGVKDTSRFPVFVGFRDKRDMS